LINWFILVGYVYGLTLVQFLFEIETFYKIQPFFLSCSDFSCGFTALPGSCCLHLLCTL